MRIPATLARWTLTYLFTHKKVLFFVVIGVVAFHFALLAIGKIYQNWDDDPDRGALAVENGAFGESYSTPVYLPDDPATEGVDESQGWSESDSLWFYNTTQGSALLPYDFFLNLEVEGSEELIRSTPVVDRYRYLPQKPTFFNPDGLPVGFVKDTYQGKDYMGYTCAACHTSQVNYNGKAIRIDGGPAMADMVGYLHAMEKGLEQTISDPAKNKRFVDRVLALDNDYSTVEAVNADLVKWANTVELYNTINHSRIEYGYARLDAFGRIYNRVLQYVPNRKDVYDVLTQVTAPGGRYLLTEEQVEKVLQGVDETIIGNDQFVIILERLQSKEAGYPGLNQRDMLRVRDAVFNEPDAPVSYPFLWDIPHADYVQWNGIAANSSVGPLGRNAGEVIGVFGILDWTAREPGFGIAAYLSGQKHKRKVVDFQHSIDLTNLKRIEQHLNSLKSPLWPEDILGKINRDQAKEGQKIYGRYCQGCHEIIERDDADRILIAKFTALGKVGTDPAMATNSATAKGKAGNFKHTFQSTDAGAVIIEHEAPVAQLLTSVTKGVVGTPDPDKSFLRRWGDWLYSIAAGLFDNPITQASIKAGDYDPDTTSNPYFSLVSYKARSLNGIWATAPYLHNGSVPTLYDLLLPAKKEGDPDEGEYRPETFFVGSREFDPDKVGFRSEGYDGKKFTTFRVGDLNDGHEYAAGRTAQRDGTVLPALTEAERKQLLEFLKTL